MNKKLQTFIIFTLILFNAALLFGQEKSIGKEDFAEITSRALNLKDKTYRTTSVYETFTGGDSKPAVSSKTIFEKVPPDRYRWITETGSEKRETITIGARRYVRLNNGDWKADASSGAGYGMGCGAGVESESYKVFENVKLGGESVNLYEKTEKLNDLSCGSKSKAEIWTEKYWISKGGLLLKIEREFKNLDTNTLRRETIVYEFDPNIKIEAPIK